MCEATEYPDQRDLAAAEGGRIPPSSEQMQPSENVRAELNLTEVDIGEAVKWTRTTWGKAIVSAFHDSAADKLNIIMGSSASQIRLRIDAETGCS